MQSTSAAFDTAINSSSRELHDKLTIQTADLVTYYLTSDDIIAGTLKVNHSCFLDGFELGTCFAADMSMSLKNLNGEWDGIDLEGATIWPYSGIRLPDTTIEYILLGTFIIDEPGRPDAELSIKAADRLILLDRPFSGVLISWPATNYQILQAISTHCSVPLASSVSSALHMDYSVAAAPEGDYSCRDIVEQICLMAAGFGRMSRIGEFEIATLPDLTGETFDVNLTTANRFAFRQTSEPVTLTGMTYKDIQENVQLGTEEYSLQIETLGILQDNRDTVLAAIWSEISGYTYVGFESEYPGNPAIDVGDSIYQLTKDEREIVSLISGHSFTHGGSCVLSAVMKPKLAVDWVAKNTKRLTAIAQKLDTTETTLTSYQQASAQMSDLLTIGLGLHRTEEVLEDGSVIQYMHNMPLLAESDIIWKQTALAWAYSTDGGDTWLGYDVNGNMVAKILSVVGINANWINAGKISAALIELLVTSGNLVENSRFALVSGNASLFEKQLLLIDNDSVIKTVMQGWCIACDANAGYLGTGTYMTDYGWFRSYKTPQSFSYDPAEMVSTAIACQVGEVYVLSYYGQTGYQFNDLGADTYGLMLGLEFTDGSSSYYEQYNVFRTPIISGDTEHETDSSLEVLEPPFYLEAYDENDDFYWYYYTTFTPTRYSVKFTLPDKTFVHSGTTDTFTGNVCIYLRDRRGSSISQTLVGKIQLEKSAYITPYSPKNGEFVPEGISFTSNGIIVRDGSTLVIPAPTEDNHAANKAYVDSLAGGTAADILTKIKTVDGAGSGLDADLLDGNHASAFDAHEIVRGELVSTNWYTIANAPRGRSFGEFNISDLSSGEHGFALILASTSFGKNNITVLHGNSYSSSTIYCARILYDTANRTYGGAKLQIRCSGVPVDVTIQMRNHDHTGWYSWDLITPVVEGTPTGWTEDSTTLVEDITNNSFKLWSSINDGSGSGLDADLLRGYGISVSSASSIPVRDSAADLYARLFRSTYRDQTSISGAMAYRVSTTDNYIRFCSSPSAIKAWLSAADASHGHSSLSNSVFEFICPTKTGSVQVGAAPDSYSQVSLFPSSDGIGNMGTPMRTWGQSVALSHNSGSARRRKENLQKYDEEVAYRHLKDMPIYKYSFKSSECVDHHIGTTIDQMPIEMIDSAHPNEGNGDIEMYSLGSGIFFSLAVCKAMQKRIEELETKIKELEYGT